MGLGDVRKIKKGEIAKAKYYMLDQDGKEVGIYEFASKRQVNAQLKYWLGERYSIPTKVTVKSLTDDAVKWEFELVQSDYGRRYNEI